MNPAISKQEIISAYTLLFGTEDEITIDTLRHLDPAAIKEAYRKRAFETHPDRSIVVGKEKDIMSEQFYEVRLAFEKLKLVAGKKRSHDNQCRVNTQQNDNKKNNSLQKTPDLPDHYYNGHIPNKKLLIGQFLYYAGIISWRTLIQAIVWQKGQRPLIGEIAVKWGILSSRDIMNILRERNIEQNYSKKFGEYAWEKGYITAFERIALLGKQRNLQSPIGEYFIKQGILSSCEIDQVVNRLRSHNR